MPVVETFLEPSQTKRVFRARSIAGALRQLNNEQLVVLTMASGQYRLFRTDLGYCVQHLLGLIPTSQKHAKSKKQIQEWLKLRETKAFLAGADIC